MHFDFDHCRFADLEVAAQAPALHAADGVMDWARLYRSTQDWIERARAAGLAAGDALVISGHKEAAFVVAMLGCLSMGVTYVPVDNINPQARLQRITALVHARAVYDAAADAFLPGAEAPRPLAVPDLAYIMFTSGSTGDPKGVQIGRESVTLFAGWIRDCLNLGPAPAPLALLRGRYRYRLLLNARRTAQVQHVIRDWLAPLRFAPGVRVSIDIDPYSFV